MDKTNVMVKFSIVGEDFSLDEITKELNITPHQCWNKGDLVKGRPITRIETNWSINTGYEVSLDVNMQIRKIKDSLQSKVDILNKIKSRYNVEYLFIIVVKVENNEKPRMYFNTDFIEFVHSIGAEFYLDMYIH